MSGETDLRALIGSMRPRLSDGIYVVATLAGADVPAGLEPLMTFREREGMTLILPRDEAEWAQLKAEFPCRMITLDVHSSLEAIGFMAAVSARLAAAGIPTNPVSGFYHDHLFVPVERAGEAIRVLEAMAVGEHLRAQSAKLREPGMPQRLPEFRMTLEPLSREAEEVIGFRWAGSEAGSRSKFGGEPEPSIESRDWPRCTHCRKPTSFVAQIDSVGDSLLFADIGVLQVFYCFDCNEPSALLDSS